MPRVLAPKSSEPIRLIETKTGPRYRVVVDAAAKGAGRRQVTKTFDTLPEARTFAVETKAAINRGDFTAPSKVTVTELAEAWLADREAESRTPGGIRTVSVNGYRSALDAPLRHIGDQSAQAITTTDIRNLLRSLATVGGRWNRGLSHRSIVYALGTLRQVFNFGVERGVLAKNPAATVRPPKRQPGDKKPIVVWSVQELTAFRAYADANAVEPWFRTAIRLTLCGLRRSEVLGLDWSHVDLTTGTVRIEQGRVKTGRGKETVHGDAKSDDSHRTVPVEAVHPGTKAALRDLWISQGQPTAGLVIVDAIGQPVDPDFYSRRFRALSNAAGVPDLGSIHNVRHTVATALHDRGVEPRKVASLLGHKVTTHLAFYVPTSDSGAAEAAEAAGQVFAAL
ncbi:MAG: hypothetical protein JWR52_3492 [Marmoricola sp.]|nr:hypothetical protein [Marmoricola sp.]